MNKHSLLLPGLLLAGLLGSAFSPLAVAHRQDPKGVDAVRFHQARPTLLAYGYGPGHGMGPAMMGSGMMGSGMMGQGSDEGTAPASVDSKRADALLGYIREQNLSCMQCHAIAGSGFGPPFAAIAEHYANRTNVESTLAEHIRQGLGRMPAGLADKTQAAQLARLIMELKPAETGRQ